MGYMRMKSELEYCKGMVITLKEAMDITEDFSEYKSLFEDLQMVQARIEELNELYRQNTIAEVEQDIKKALLKLKRIVSL